MVRGSEPPSSERPRLDDPAAADADDAVEAAGDVAGGAGVDVSSLPIAGLTRGRLLTLAALFAAAWIAIAFARQVGAAGELGDRADGLRADNAAGEQRVAALQRELALVQTPEYVAQQARAYRLGTANEVPFTLSADAPPLPADAPGSASVRLGADPGRASPLEAWLTLLLAPDD